MNKVYTVFFGGRETHHVGAGVCLWKTPSRRGGGQLKVRNDRDGLDLFGPGEFLAVADGQRGLWWSPPRVYPAGGSGQDFAERDLFPG